MHKKELEERVDYISSTKLLTSDKYRIWGYDSIGVIAGIIFIIWGIMNYNFSILWRFTLIILGVILFVVCSVRIERRYNKFKAEILGEMKKFQN